MSVLEISRLRAAVNGERRDAGNPVTREEELTAVVNECSMLGCAVLLSLASMEMHCEGFPETFHFGTEGARDWTFDGSSDTWRIDPVASRNIRMSDRTADAEDFFEKSFLPALLYNLDMKGSRIATEVFTSISRICTDGDRIRLCMLFERLPVHSVLSVMRHATTLAGVLGIDNDGIVEMVKYWFQTTERDLSHRFIANVFSASEPEDKSDLRSHSLWLRGCLDAYDRRHWPQVRIAPAA